MANHIFLTLQHKTSLGNHLCANTAAYTRTKDLIKELKGE